MLVGPLHLPEEEFLRRHSRWYENSNGRPVSEVLQIYPRSHTHAGDASGLEMVEAAGRSMIVDHVQFDLIPDDLLAETDLSAYRVIVTASPTGWDAKRLAMFRAAGGTVIGVPPSEQQAAAPEWKTLPARVVRNLPVHSGGSRQAAPFLEELNRALGTRRLVLDAPYTVEAHLFQQPGALVVHLVNHNHAEQAAGNSVVEREAPIAAAPVAITLALDELSSARRVTFLDPDAEASPTLTVTRRGSNIEFTTPGFLAYGVCVIELEK
jgi:hypothetical protein